MSKDTKQVLLGDIAEIRHGYAFKSECFRSEPTEYVLLTPGNFHRDQYLYFGENTKYYEGEIPNGYVLENGDLLVVMTDLTKEMTILGNAVILESEKLVLHNQRIGKVIITNPDLAHKYFLMYLLNSPIVQNRIKATASGTTVRHTSPKKILSIEIPLPPLPEQRKIAQILSTWDEAIALVEQLIAALEQRKKGLMQRLLTGQVRFPGFEEAWKEVRLGDVAEVKGGKRLPKGNKLVPYDTGYPYIRVSDMSENGLNIENIMFVPPEIAPSIKAYRIFKDEIYLSVAGTVGLVGTIPQELDGANLTENADRLTSIRVNQEYLLDVLRSQIIRREIDRVITQNAQPKLALTRIREFVIPLPSKEEQGKIAEFLRLLASQVVFLGQYVTVLREQKKGLMQRLLTGQVRVQVDEE